ncbi:Domain of unknown function (DUF2431) [Seminavis robusta]|uniref:25S rRNA (uridine-N(3))-methyltransferase BMT5-like domain-containing protein n=1 Tax=Seminavis robusta TaxID=568900 RepID=A0A9N8HDC3_9STRA|nr:Domain of unknown function (DUF2431) [Seminavis robusta]|eukprot:Sro337_g120560.1 Domain of unknown function (DUF2431) (375) ;mRNA; f:23080-24204
MDTPVEHQENFVKDKDPTEDDPSQIPTRNLEHLFGSSTTIRCALQNHCIPCGYKICNSDVALDGEFNKVVPNQRPEQCPRAKKQEGPDYSMGYQTNGMRVLTVGDGDFSFSLAVARLLSSATKSFKKKKKGVNLVATSYESKETLQRVYPRFEETSAELTDLGATLCYQVDATRLHETLPPSRTLSSFHRIVWNFPCTAIDEGQDGQNDAMESNKQLVRTFVENARRLVDPGGGEIHMCHKTKPPFNQWRIEQVAVEKCQKDGPRVVYRGRVVLDKCLLPPYQPRKALHSKSFPCHDACFYVFRVGDKKSDTVQETIRENLSSEFDPTEDNKRETLVPVTRKLVLTIRRSLLDQAANKHRKSRQGGRQQKRRKR